MHAEKLLGDIARIAEQAGREIKNAYGAPGGAVHTKADGSPLTAADRAAHLLIATELARLTPDIPLLSEESPAEIFTARRAWEKFWLVDPLDGTAEFLARNDEFSVNIALIDKTAPIMGVVHVPMKQRTYFARKGAEAFVREENKKPRVMTVNKKHTDEVTVLLSRTEKNSAHSKKFLRAIKKDFAHIRTIALGSSLKLCLIAEGAADVYPRFGATSEWDTAAAQCIVEAAGGAVTDFDGAALRYNKDSLRNPWFIAHAAHRRAQFLRYD